MRIGLLPLRVKPRAVQINLEHLEARLAEITHHQPDLVCLPECTLTGYLYENNDLQQFAEPIGGPTRQHMSKLAHTHRIYLCYGFLERDETGFFNSAAMLDPDGNVIHLHRKFCEKTPFQNGAAAASFDTALGRLGILICGDLFEVDPKKLDCTTRLMLVPMSRSFDGRSPDPARWEAGERHAYLDAVKRIGIIGAIVNSLEETSEDGSFGGALLVSADGSLLAESPHGTDQPLIWDFQI